MAVTAARRVATSPETSLKAATAARIAHTWLTLSASATQRPAAPKTSRWNIPSLLRQRSCTGSCPAKLGSRAYWNWAAPARTGNGNLGAGQRVSRHQLVGMPPARQRLDAGEPRRDVLVLSRDVEAELNRRIVEVADEREVRDGRAAAEDVRAGGEPLVND